MRILYLITKSQAGGAQTHILQLGKFLSAKGNDVAVMSCPGGFLEKALIENNIKFYPNIYFKNSFNPIFGLLAIKEIVKVLGNFKPDIVSCHSTYAGFWGRIAINRKIPTIFTAHGWGFTEGISFFRRQAVVIFEKIVSPMTRKIICVSEHDRQLGLKYKIASQDKILTIHNGVELQSDISYRSLKFPIKVSFVARFVKQKDQLLFCEAINELNLEDRKKIITHFIGDGPNKKLVESFVIKNKISNNFKFLGELKREYVFKYLKESDLFALIANWEGFPRSILEAMSCGLPVIASDVGGVNEVVDEKVGLLLRKGDKEEIKKALLFFISNPEALKNLGLNAKIRVENDFSLEKMLNKTENLYFSLLKSN